MLCNRHSFGGLSLVFLHTLLSLSDCPFFIQVIVLAEPWIFYPDRSIRRIRTTLLSACQQFLLVAKGSLDVVEAGREVWGSLYLTTSCLEPLHLLALQLDSTKGLLSSVQRNFLRPNLARLRSHLCVAPQGVRTWDNAREVAGDLPSRSWPLLLMLVLLSRHDLSIVAGANLGQRCGRLYA